VAFRPASSRIKHPLEHLILEIQQALHDQRLPADRQHQQPQLRPVENPPQLVPLQQRRVAQILLQRPSSDSNDDDDAPESRRISIGTSPSLPFKYSSVLRSALAKAVIAPAFAMKVSHALP
jgi:hypothetical protein